MSDRVITIDMGGIKINGQPLGAGKRTLTLQSDGTEVTLLEGAKPFGSFPDEDAALLMYGMVAGLNDGRTSGFQQGSAAQAAATSDQRTKLDQERQQLLDLEKAFASRPINVVLPSMKKVITLKHDKVKGVDTAEIEVVPEKVRPRFGEQLPA
jgi:hypothetical protein